MTLRRLPMSRSTRARNSAGLLAWGCPPSSCSRWRTAGVESAAATALPTAPPTGTTPQPLPPGYADPNAGAAPYTDPNMLPQGQGQGYSQGQGQVQGQAPGEPIVVDPLTGQMMTERELRRLERDRRRQAEGNGAQGGGDPVGNLLRDLFNQN